MVGGAAAAAAAWRNAFRSARGTLPSCNVVAMAAATTAGGGGMMMMMMMTPQDQKGRRSADSEDFSSSLHFRSSSSSTSSWNHPLWTTTAMAGTTTVCEAVSKKPLPPPSSSQKATTPLRRRMTNVGRFSLLSETATNPSIPVLVLCLRGSSGSTTTTTKPWTAKDFVELYQQRKIEERHERFRSVLEDHDTPHRFLVLPPSHYHHHHHDETMSTTAPQSSSSDVGPRVRDMVVYPQIYRNELKAMIAEALVKPMDLTNGLWEAWVGSGGTMGQSGAVALSSVTTPPTTGTSRDVESLLLFRAHHCMADGVSLGAIFGDLMDEAEDFRTHIEQQVVAFRLQQRKRSSWWRKFLFFLYYWCWGSLKAIGYQMYLFVYSIAFAPPNPWKVLQQQSKMRDPSIEGTAAARTLSWVELTTVEEAKRVAEYFTQQHPTNSSKRQKMTINDIFCSCVTGATTRLMEYHRQEQKNPHLTLPYLNLVIPVHMSGGILLPGSPLGNKIGAMVNQVPAEAVTKASDRLHAVHETLWNRKQTPAAPLSFLVATMFGGTLGTLLGKGITSWLFSKAHVNSSIVVTNVRGPETAAHMGGRRVETHLGFLPLPPGVPIGMVITSYNQRITLTVMAESWAVPDADRFLSWVVEEYQELVHEAQVAP